MAEGTPSHRMTYGGYLQLNELLSLQDGPEGYSPAPSNDEQHFIVVHQAFELWFKLILRELKEAHLLLNQEHVPEEILPQMVHHLDRVTEIFRLLSNQWKVMETLTPQGFLAFRDKLGTSSGFESWQMRELEVLLGLDNSQRMGGMDPLLHMKKLAQEGKVTAQVLSDFEATSNQPSLCDALSAWLARTPINGSLAGSKDDADVLTAFVDRHLEAMRSHGEEVIAHIVAIGHGEEAPVRARIEASTEQAEHFLRPDGVVSRSRAGLLFIESYRELPLLSWPRKLIDSFVGLEQSMILFRSAHARMVERMIGRRMGTGGSSGVDYLDATTKYRVFVDLWAVRTLLVKRDALPDVKQAAFYGFAARNED
ncbi:MAG: tryptophan 2,3-dioxygenase [Euryarchaeota archaeon]|jgi:tryptophan 2,3-dioxygenase|nr:tryptophan 2,3-dioxygenase [Euryarchaeota archaeon]MBT5025420.1 tryptophan 2,3-dioxygenase [Euryarchaeota archaeon]MBT6254608.1 tryptophan 2,3-dioxygenase [Euryarchaeota archaeon]MBT6528408.1 tryptophan 2,3-dioxygenase [Euryarchaeota archaeon]MBT7960330.1 tryptophan 2,3-dioxygenase [Euryarchaeota archaeon]